MPRNLPHFTRCAAPGVAGRFSIPGALATLLAVGIIGYFALAAAGVPCAGVAAAALGLIAALDQFEHWFYNERLMCILADQCAIGTVAGIPKAACDGDRKIDILIAPYGFLEVDRNLMSNAVAALVATGFPPAPPDLATNRTVRLAYVEGLTAAQRRQLYLELVEKHMLNQAGRGFQGHFYQKRQPPMPAAAFINTPNGNPMFRFDGDEIDPPGALDSFFCETLLGVPNDETSEHRLVPYMHCEIEGNRLQRGLTNLKLSIAAFGAAYAAFCAACNVLLPGVGVILCSVIAGALAALFAWLAWLLSKLFNDPDDGEVSELPLDLPDPAAPDETSSSSRGDVVLLFGDWIKDTEHNEYFEIHPIKAWFLLCRDPDGAATVVDDPNAPGCEFDVARVTEQDLQEMCALVQRSETTEPPFLHPATTPTALSVAGGLAPG